MTRAATAVTAEAESRDAGMSLGAQLNSALVGAAADAVIVFAAPEYDHAAFLRGVMDMCHPEHLLGCSSAGEFRGTEFFEYGASALALSAPEMTFRTSCGSGIIADREGVATQLLGGFAGPRELHYRYRTALILADALTGYTDDLIARLALRTAGTYQFVGGGAGDNARFQHTPVFYGADVYTDAAVALEILSNKPLGIGVSHGWEPATPPMRVTGSDGLRLTGVNASPAVEMFERHAEALHQTFDRTAPLPFFLHHILGIAMPGGYQLRVPLSVEDDGSILCAADIPTGSLVHIMRSSSEAATQAARTAAENALRQLGNHPPEVALFFDCVATRLRLGEQFGDELTALNQALDGLDAVGCNSHGQIARAEGQFSGFHNCTAVVCAIPQ